MASSSHATAESPSVSKDENITCVIVLGMAGSGKTTLVQVGYVHLDALMLTRISCDVVTFLTSPTSN